MRIMIDLPPSEVWRFSELAEAQGVKPGDVLRAELELRRPARDLPDAVAGRVAAGWSDADIARELNETNATVSNMRRKLGLPANRNRERGGGGRRTT